MTYGIGEEFISDGMVVKTVRKASPSDADKIEVPITDYETAYDFSEAGEKRVVIPTLRRMWRGTKSYLMPIYL